MKLYSYLRNRFLKWWAGFFAGTTLLGLLMEWTELHRHTSKNLISLTLFHKLQWIGAKIPVLYLKITPLLVFVATIAAVWQVFIYREWIILRTNGMKVRQLLWPFIQGATFIGLFHLCILHPLAHQSFIYLSNIDSSPQQALPSWHLSTLKTPQGPLNIIYTPPRPSSHKGVFYVMNARGENTGLWLTENTHVSQNQLQLHRTWAAQPQVSLHYKSVTPFPYELDLKNLPTSHTLSAIPATVLPFLALWDKTKAQDDPALKIALHGQYTLLLWLGIVTYVAFHLVVYIGECSRFVWLMPAALGTGMFLYLTYTLSHALGRAALIHPTLAILLPLALGICLGSTLTFMRQWAQKSLLK